MSWFDTEGRLPLHVIFSQTNYKRNLAGQPFVTRANAKQLEAVSEKIGVLLQGNGFWRESIGEGDTTLLNSLAEKGYIDADLLSASAVRAVYFNEPCSLAVSVGGRDLITVRAILSGAAVTDTRNIASGAEELLDREFEFAYSDTRGYISSSPATCGSCAVFSALLYLPSLAFYGSFNKTARRLALSGVEIAPFFTQDGGGGDLYLLTHTPSHLCDESISAASLDKMISVIIEEERNAERMIFKERSKIIVDAAWRAYGSLLYCRILSENELLSFCSAIRFALAACDEKSVALPPVSVVTLNSLLAKGLNYSVINEAGSCSSEEELLVKRAKLISGMIYSASGQGAI